MTAVQMLAVGRNWRLVVQSGPRVSLCALGFASEETDRIGVRPSGLTSYAISPPPSISLFTKTIPGKRSVFKAAHLFVCLFVLKIFHRTGSREFVKQINLNAFPLLSVFSPHV